MAYIGTKPTIGNFQICDAISVVNGQAAYTMQVGSVNVLPQSANHMIVSLNGVIQKPGSSFTVSGSTITFASNLVTNDVIDFIQILGSVLDLGVPSDATVTAAKIGANAVTAAKLNNDIISGSTELASEPADTDEFLVSDAGTLKRIDYSLIKGGGITNAQTFKVTTNTNISGSGYLQSNIADTSLAGYAGKGSIVSQSSGTFSFSSTGYYLIMWTFYAEFTVSGSQDTGTFEIQVTNDNSSYKDMIRIGKMFDFAENTADGISLQCLVNVDNTSNDKVRFGYGTGNGHDGVTIYGSDSSGNYNRCVMTFIRLGDSV